MEPDMHIFVESKLDWVKLPDGARTAERGDNMKKMWPKRGMKTKVQQLMEVRGKVKTRKKTCLLPAWFL